MADYEVVVVGLGAMGSSIAHHLARRGRRVLGIEQFTPAHALGSSHGGSRIVRKAYYEDPAYVPLLRRSYELFDELSADYGEQLFTRCGALMVGRPDDEVVTGALLSARSHGLEHELLDAAEARARFPMFAVPPDQVAVFEADAGYARPEPTVLANLALAGDRGAELWFDTEVESIELGPSGVHVVAGGDEVTADRVVIATGAWAPKLARLDQLGIAVSRETMHWFEPTGPITDFDPEHLPVFLWDRPLVDSTRDTTIYGFPHLAGETGLKVGFYHSGLELNADPDRLDRVTSAEAATDLARVLAEFMPPVPGRWVNGQVCMYAGVPGDHFVLGPHPGASGRVVLAVGMSGHGFKFAPVIGEVVADLLDDGRSKFDLEFLSPARLMAGR